MSSELFKQAIKNKKGTYSEVDSWHTFQCNVCRQFFTMKLEYDGDSNPYWTGSTKKCKHNDYFKIEKQ